MILHAMEFKHKWSIWIRRPRKEGTSGIIVKVEKEEVEEGGCRSWFRKMCPCCCEPQASNSYDITDKVEVVPFTPVADKDPPKFLPLTNGNEMEGEIAQPFMMTFPLVEQSFFVI